MKKEYSWHSLSLSTSVKQMNGHMIKGNHTNRISKHASTDTLTAERSPVSLALFVMGTAIVFILSRISSINILIPFLAALYPTKLIAYLYGKRRGTISSLVFSLFIVLSVIQRQWNSGQSQISIPLLLLGSGLLILASFVTGFLSDSNKQRIVKLNQQKQTEKSLADENNRIQEILDHQQDLILRFDQNLHIIYMNLTGIDFFNLDQNNLFAISISELIESKYRIQFSKYIHNFKHSKEKVHPDLILLPIYNHAGLKQYFEWSVSLIGEIDDPQRQYQAVGRNITTQYLAKLAEKENLEVAESFKEIASILNSTLEIDEVLGKVLESIGRVVPHDAANIMLIEKDYAFMVKLVGYEKFIPHMPEFRNTQFPLDLHNMKKMAATHKPVYIADLKNDPNWVALPENDWVGSYLGAPLICKERLIGFLNLDCTRKNFFTEKHISWLQAFADQAAIAIQNAQYYKEAQRRSLHFARLNEAMHFSSHAAKISEVLEPLDSIFRELFAISSMRTYLWDETQQRYQIERIGLSDTITARSYLDPEISSLFIEKAIVICSQEESRQIWSSSDKLDKRSPEHIVILPLVVNQRKFGLMLLAFIEEVSLSTTELDLMQQFALQTSLAISKIQLINREIERSQEITHKNRILETLTRVSTRVELDLNIPAFFANIISGLGQNNIGCLAAILDEDGHNVDIFSSTESEKSEGVADTLPGWNDPQAMKAIASFFDYRELFEGKGALYIENIGAFAAQTLQWSENTFGKPFWPGKLIPAQVPGYLIPLLINDQVSGILMLWGEHLQSNDSSSVVIFASQTANAIEKARLYNKISQLALTDPLTGFYNRRGLEELGNHEIERSTRFGNHLGALMIDIDHFKDINDHFGHPVGDKVLKIMAEILRYHLRQVDIICRYGGDEFFILLPEANITNANLIAERLRSAIADEIFLPEVGPIRATISIGVCQLTNTRNSLTKLVQCADEALYQAKSIGRNRIFHRTNETAT